MGNYYCFVTVSGDQVIDVELHNCISQSSALDMGLNIVKDYESQNVDFDRVEIWDCCGEGFVIGLTTL